ncbi:MAG: hypothetical protein QOJ40_789 [Verrucomicrobiota bacterium]
MRCGGRDAAMKRGSKRHLRDGKDSVLTSQGDEAFRRRKKRPHVRDGKDSVLTRWGDDAIPDSPRPEASCMGGLWTAFQSLKVLLR